MTSIRIKSLFIVALSICAPLDTLSAAERTIEKLPQSTVKQLSCRRARIMCG